MTECGMRRSFHKVAPCGRPLDGIHLMRESSIGQLGADFLFGPEIRKYGDEISTSAAKLRVANIQYKDFSQRVPQGYDHEKIVSETRCVGHARNSKILFVSSGSFVGEVRATLPELALRMNSRATSAISRMNAGVRLWASSVSAAINYSLMGIVPWPSQAELGGVPEASMWLPGRSFAPTVTQRSYIQRFRSANCLSSLILQNPMYLRARRLVARNAKPLFRLCGLTFDILRRD
jgi:hypothetical protein